MVGDGLQIGRRCSKQVTGIDVKRHGIPGKDSVRCGRYINRNARRYKGLHGHARGSHRGFQSRHLEIHAIGSGWNIVRPGHGEANCAKLRQCSVPGLKDTAIRSEHLERNRKGVWATHHGIAYNRMYVSRFAGAVDSAVGDEKGVVAFAVMGTSTCVSVLPDCGTMQRQVGDIFAKLCRDEKRRFL